VDFLPEQVVQPEAVGKVIGVGEGQFAWQLHRAMLQG
jgi:hypothetical protein